MSSDLKSTLHSRILTPTFALVYIITLYIAIFSAISLADPCLSYVSGTNHCQNCSSGYTFALVNSTTTFCAKVYNNSANQTLCVINDTYYQNDTSYNTTYQYLTTFTIAYQFCFNCTTFFQTSDGQSLCYGGCPQSVTPYYKYKTIDSQSIGCQTCALQDYQMQTILNYDFISLYVKTCTANIDNTACDMTEFYDETSNLCVACIDKYPRCGACTKDECLITLYQYYNATGLYNYSSGNFEINQFIFWLCNYGAVYTSVGNTCYSSGISHCQVAYISASNSESCYICDAGYTSQRGVLGCVARNVTNTTYTYFIRSGAAYNTTDNIGYYFNSSTNTTATSGTTPDQPFYFIMSAMQTIFNSTKSSILNANVTIYLGKGYHFFFYCDTYSGTIFNAQNIIQYCRQFYWQLHQYAMKNDNIVMYFKPLECSLAASLGYQNNANFSSMCVNLTTMERPTIFINQAYSYFQIYGFARFENIIFSGQNQLVQSVISTNDLSTLPILYCNVTSEPNVGDQSLQLQAVNNSNFSVNYKCRNVNYTGSSVPNTSNSSFTCNRNVDSYFYGNEESSLNCPGEPTYYYYFYLQEYNIEVPIVPRRRNTLFNLYAFPEYLSIYKSPPELQLYNCSFQYFLQNYESLINVETNDFQYLTMGFNEPSHNDSIYNYSFIFYAGGERGAKITIKDSKFKHSSFNKGLITYRKQPYVDETDLLGYGNFTYYLMRQPYVQDNGSFIIIEGSTFYNLNSGFQNISALAIYGGKDVFRTMDVNNTIIQYQGFVHKGTVLNIEDFGGYVKIYNCTFSYNMHFIPQILQTNYSSSRSSNNIANFMDNSKTDEYKMAACDQDTKEDIYFFSSGVNEDDDLDTYYDLFERLSLIYISRNRDMVIINNNTFLSNIGTFGGAISINSQNWDAGKTPYIVIKDNTFRQNMAYFSGNAIYIRNSKNENDLTKICGGTNLINNIFEHNIGMKIHNGGAVSISCYYVTGHLQQDYFSTSGQSIINETMNYQSLTTTILDPSNSSYTFQIYPFAVNIQDCLFNENYAGSKGTALYMRRLSNIRVSNCTFKNNGPVLSYFESLYSPYYQYLSQRTMTYYDVNGVCTDEFQYLSNCQTDGSIIDWPHVQGALYIEHCQDELCVSGGLEMNLLLENSVFQNNQIGYIMDDQFPQNLSSQLFIQGGVNNTIKNCTFNNSNGSYQQLPTQKLLNFFPSQYFASQQASLIYIEVIPVTDDESIYSTTISNCSFINNQHIQPLGLTTSQNYFGSLITASSPYSYDSSLHTSTLSILNTTFQDNKFIGLNTQLIFVKNVLLTLKNTLFQNNGILQQASASQSYMYYQDSSQVFTQSGYFSFKSYYFYEYQDYGIIYMEGIQKFINGAYHQIVNNTFKYTFSKQSSIIFVNVANQFIFLNGNQYMNNFVESGAIINGYGLVTTYLMSGSSTEASSSDMNTTILVMNDIFQNQISSTGIFSFDFSNSPLTLNIAIYNTLFEDNFQETSQGLFTLSQLGKIQISNCQFSIRVDKSTSEKNFNSQFIPITYTLNYLINTSLIYQNSISDYFAGSRVFLFSQIQNLNKVIYFGNQAQSINQEYLEYIEITNCQFNNFYSSSSGVLITITDGSYLIISSNSTSQRNVTNCSVGDQGIFYIQNSTVIAQNLNVFNSSSSDSTAIFYLTQSSTLQIYNSFFMYNTAYTYGMAYITGSSNIYCSYCTFIQNSVELESSVIYADNNPSGGVIITNSIFTNNTSSSNLFNLITTPTTITNSDFLDNESQLVCNGITGTNSIITLINATINYTTNEFINNNNYKVDACFFNLNFLTTLNISNSVIQNCRGGTAGVMYATGYSSIYIDSNSIFKDNLSSEDASGSILYFLTTQEVSIANSTFINNGIIDIYVQRATASIYNCNFSIGDQQFIYAYASAINITNSIFQNGTNNNILGKALYCYCYSLNVINSTFYNLGSVKGGALYLSSSTTSSQQLIQGNKFISNQAQFGGGIYINDAINLTLQNNLFLDNQAIVITPTTETSGQLTSNGLGGAVYFGCSNIAIYLANNCSLLIGSENIFESNHAEDDGGAIIWVANPFKDDGSNIYTNNTAIYGSNQASYPADLFIYFISNNDYYDPVNNSASQQTMLQGTSQLTFEKIVSGVSFSFLVFILDQEGNIYNTDNESVATFKDANPSQSVLLNGNEIKASNGIYNFSAFTVITQPATNISLQVSITGLTTYGNDISFIENPLNVSIQLRGCVSGEQMLNLACSQCPYGYYLYDAPTNDTSCKQCEANSICAGSNIVYPSAGYWRTNNTSEDWIECSRPKSCLEGDADHLTSNCADGYEGIVCGDCQDGYSRQSDFECELCPEQRSNIIKLTFIGVLVIVIVVLLVASTLTSSVKTSQTQYSVYFKIMTSHFQIINAMSNINFEWPNYISSLYNSFVQVSSVSQQIFSIDCFLKNETQGLDLGIYFQKLMLYGFLPFILAVLDMGFWLIYTIFRGKFSNLMNSFTSTLVILLFLVHPTITQEMFQAFNCVEIAGVYYLRADVNYECYKGEHLKYLVIIVIPSLIIWSFGIPLFALILLMRNKKTILKEATQTEFTQQELEEIRSVKVKYGFMFNGYKTKQYYYEIIIQYRKVVLIMVTVILSIVSPEIQALLSFLVLILSMLYQHNHKPFQTAVLNRMELLSLFVSTTTMYSGMYFITSQHYDYSSNETLQWCFMILLIFPNMFYFFYWFYYTVLEVTKYVHSKGPRYFCLLTLGLCNYKRFQLKYMDNLRQTTMSEIPKKDSGDLKGMLDESEESKFVDYSPNKSMNQTKPNKSQKIQESGKRLIEGKEPQNNEQVRGIVKKWQTQKGDKKKDRAKNYLDLSPAFDAENNNGKKQKKKNALPIPELNLHQIIDQQIKKKKNKQVKTDEKDRNDGEEAKVKSKTKGSSKKMDKVEEFDLEIDDIEDVKVQDKNIKKRNKSKSNKEFD